FLVLRIVQRLLEFLQTLEQLIFFGGDDRSRRDKSRDACGRQCEPRVYLRPRARVDAVADLTHRLAQRAVHRSARIVRLALQELRLGELRLRMLWPIVLPRRLGRRVRSVGVARRAVTHTSPPFSCGSRRSSCAPRGSY